MKANRRKQRNLLKVQKSRNAAATESGFFLLFFQSFLLFFFCIFPNLVSNCYIPTVYWSWMCVLICIFSVSQPIWRKRRCVLFWRGGFCYYCGKSEKWGSEFWFLGVNPFEMGVKGSVLFCLWKRWTGAPFSWVTADRSRVFAVGLCRD